MTLMHTKLIKKKTDCRYLESPKWSLLFEKPLYSNLLF